uniref:Uncharacterized protein n=1 Tax=Arundo donax TaxID=35708 RepID=A0A0A9CXR2_ARUDO
MKSPVPKAHRQKQLHNRTKSRARRKSRGAVHPSRRNPTGTKRKITPTSTRGTTGEAPAGTEEEQIATTQRRCTTNQTDRASTKA